VRLAVEGTGYQSAVEAYVTGNLLAVDVCRSLSARLDGYAGMAGDDSTAADFATSYDEAAAECLAAVGELTFGLAALGHLTDASLRNLSWADTVTGPATMADRSIGMRPAPPPSSLGADSSSLPGWANVVLDILEGVFWPGADTDRLRSAGAAWRAAATSVGLLSAHCSTALAALAGEVSPEIPLAIAATEELRGRVDALADQLVAVGTACETYADQVDDKRAELLDLLEELAWEFGVGAVVSGILTAVSLGGASAAAGGAGAARIAAASDEAGGILASLAALTRGTATTLRPIAATVRDSRAYLARLAAARRMAVTEHGSLRLGREFDFPRGWLSAHEHSGSHTLLKHVGRSDEQLLQRLASETNLPHASTFISQDRAEEVLSSFLRQRNGSISDWLSSDTARLRLEGYLHLMTGRTAWPDGRVDFVNGIRAILVRDASMPHGYRVLTSFPQP
jgi:hypothetical protein